MLLAPRLLHIYHAHKETSIINIPYWLIFYLPNVISWSPAECLISGTNPSCMRNETDFTKPLNTSSKNNRIRYL